VSQEQLSTEHIKQILNRLLFDLKIETLTLNPDMQRKYKDVGPWYRPAAQQVSHYDRFTSVPCGVCPVFQKCAPGGVISPETCKYLTQWLDDGEMEASAR
jgi:DNA-directed RNA polymerase III subunit RPC6